MAFSRREFMKDVALAGAFIFINPLNFVKGNKKTSNDKLIRGVYVPGWKAISKKSIDDFIELKNSAGINTLMVDVKNVRGNLFYSPKNKIARSIDAQVETKKEEKRSLNFDYLHNQANKNDINLIARHAMFRDHLLYDRKPEFRLWKGKYQKWVDMMNKNVVDYNVDLLKEESKLGFNNIVLDYIRFPASKIFDNEKYKCNVIDNVVKRTKQELGNNIKLGVQTFGYSSWSYERSGVGQRISTLEKYTDIIYPMLYPSHFWKDSLDFENPGENPYEIIKSGYEKTKEKVAKNTEVIPMIQAFGYDKEKFREQIRAVEDYDIKGFICWNSKGNYDVIKE